MIAMLVSALRSQWIASALLLPLLFLSIDKGVDIYNGQQEKADTAREQRLEKLAVSGGQLDRAIAAYYDSLAELGMAERGVKAPASFQVTPVIDARAALSASRKSALEAFAQHAADVQALRGVLEPNATKKYIASLVAINKIIEAAPDVRNTGHNITTLGQLVLERNQLVDQSKA